MPKSSLRQRKIEGRVMHEFAHGELKTGPGGKGGKAKSRKQAIAIALSEAGASNYQSAKKNRRNLARTERKEARGETAQQEKEGRYHVGARGKRESSPAMGGKNATRTTKSGRRAAHTGAVKAGGATKSTLYRRAKSHGVEGRSRMTKRQLVNALS
jgi:Family of unknown function (DUF6496)